MTNRTNILGEKLDKGIVFKSPFAQRIAVKNEPDSKWSFIVPTLV